MPAFIEHHLKHHVHAALLLALTAAATGCSTVPGPAELRTACTGLAGRTVPAAAIGLPSGDARVASAQVVAATPGSLQTNGFNPGLPEYCRVLGQIAPRDPAAQPIQFQVNLPLAWNGKALQYGGGGFNGVLVTGLAPLRDAAPDDPLPLARGYATFGTDSGHQASASPPSDPGAFAQNDEMLENFAYASYKKLRDVAVVLMQGVYGRRPAQVYYFGGSEGGREGLTMAQRFPADYDGIVSVVPVIHWTGLFHAFVRHEVPQFGSWLPAAKTGLIARAVAEDCDALDGLADGVIHNYLACPAKVNLARLRCAAGAADTSACLTEGELAVAQSTLTPYDFPFPLANGLTRYPAWLPGHEDALDGPQALSLVRWVTGSAAPTVPPNAATAATQWLYGSNWVRHAIARDAALDVRGYRPQDYRERVQQTSTLMDSTNPDLSAFFARGGKLILRENAADRAQSPAMGFAYHAAVVARLGAAAVEQSMRLYVSPGSTHTGNSRAVGSGAAVPTMVDLLDPLDRWVTQGVAPADALVQTVKAPVPPFALQAARPLCRYPAYPHYMGGDAKRAESYGCRTAER